ncbi:hypothetical protein [Amycolatopsis sp. Hca4]|nr:hypothetical protein [Amycolatopsis sp. Hca4]
MVLAVSAFLLSPATAEAALPGWVTLTESALQGRCRCSSGAATTWR